MNTRFLAPVLPASMAGHAPQESGFAPAPSVVSSAVLRARLPLALTAGLLAGLAVWAALLPDQRATAVAGDPDAVPLAWSRSADRVPRLAWKAPVLANLPETQERWSRIGLAGEEIEDRLTIGDVAGSGAFALLFSTRVPARSADASFYVAAVRAAAKLALVAGRVPQPVSHEGRFGPTETAVMSLSPIARGAVSRENCLAWRTDVGTSGVSLAGFVCMPAPQRADAAMLECLLANLSSADGAIRRLPDVAACRENPTMAVGSRIKTAVVRARQ